MNGATIGKVILALVVFPVVGHAIFTAVTVLLGFMLPSLLAMAGSWSDMLGKGLVVATVLVAVRSSFGVCRRLWPTTTVR